jgi:hypothetical protein
MFDTFDAMRVQHWLSRWPPRASPESWGRGPFPGIGDLAQAPGPQTIDLDHGPMRWHDANAYTLLHHGSLQDRAEPFRPVRLIPNIRGLRAIVEWAPWPIDPSSTTERPTRAPHRIRIVSDEREQAIITFGRFELVPRGATTARAEHDPPWVALRQAIDDRDAITFMALVLRAQDGLGTVQARARMGIEQAIQALDAAVDAGWSLELLRTVAPDLLERCMSRLAPAELMWLTLDATMASRGALAVLAATRLSQHAQASADERAWATMALPSLWAWLHEPPADDSPLGSRRLACDRALRPILLGELSALTAHDGGAS